MTNEGKRRAPTTPLKRKAKKPRSFIVLLELMELAYEEMDDIELTVHYRDEDRRKDFKEAQLYGFMFNLLR